MKRKQNDITVTADTAALLPAQAKLRQASKERIEAAEDAGKALEHSFKALAVKALDREADE